MSFWNLIFTNFDESPSDSLIILTTIFKVLIFTPWIIFTRYSTRKLNPFLICNNCPIFGRLLIKRSIIIIIAYVMNSIICMILYFEYTNTIVFLQLYWINRTLLNFSLCLKLVYLWNWLTQLLFGDRGIFRLLLFLVIN